MYAMIFTYIWHKSMVNVGKYTIMDPMGNVDHVFHGIFYFVSLRKQLDTHMATVTKPKLSHVYKSTGRVGWNGMDSYTRYTWVFPKIEVPQNGWFIMVNPFKMDDWGVPPFKETPLCW